MIDPKRFCCTTLTFSAPFAKKLAAMSTAGFGSVEIWPRDVYEPFGGLTASRAMLDDNGLSIGCYQGLRDFEGASVLQRNRQFDTARQLMDQMATLGSDLLVLCSNTDPEASADPSRISDDLASLGDEAASRGMRVAYEALFYTPHISDYRDAWEAVKRTNHPAVGLVLDCAHIFALGLPIDAIDTIDPDKIFLVELSDLPASTLPPREVNGNYRLFPGEGAHDAAAFLHRIERRGYLGIYAVEVFNAHYLTQDPSVVAERAYASLTALAHEPPPV